MDSIKYEQVFIAIDAIQLSEIFLKANHNPTNHFY
jgi:hypothetical protein